MLFALSLLPKPHVTGSDFCQVHFNCGVSLYVCQLGHERMTISLLLDTERLCGPFCDTSPQTLSTYSRTET